MNEPKLRFKADDGSQFPDWEEHKIKEFVTESNILGHTGKEAKKLTVKLWAKGVVPKEKVEECNGRIADFGSLIEQLKAELSAKSYTSYEDLYKTYHTKYTTIVEKYQK